MIFSSLLSLFHFPHGAFAITQQMHPFRHSGNDAGIQAMDGNLPIAQTLDSDEVLA